MMSVFYRLAKPFRNQQVRGSTPLSGSMKKQKGVRVFSNPFFQVLQAYIFSIFFLFI